jgi:hypothetical protein
MSIYKTEFRTISKFISVTMTSFYFYLCVLWLRKMLRKNASNTTKLYWLFYDLISKHRDPNNVFSLCSRIVSMNQFISEFRFFNSIFVLLNFSHYLSQKNILLEELKFKLMWVCLWTDPTIGVKVIRGELPKRNSTSWLVRCNLITFFGVEAAKVNSDINICMSVYINIYLTSARVCHDVTTM